MDVVEECQAKMQKRLYFLRSLRKHFEEAPVTGSSINDQAVDRIFKTNLDWPSTGWGYDKLAQRKEDTLAFLDVWIEELQNHWACDDIGRWSEEPRGNK